MKNARMKRFIAGLLASVISISTFSTLALADSSYYSSTLGTKASLGSPLSNADFASNMWDKWEMAVFGIFLSNYVKVGEESYKDAFKSGGDGREALQFNSGGDVNSAGILNSMLETAIASQSQVQNVSVQYNYIELGADTNLDLGKRNARFNDLMPVLQFQDSGSDTLPIKKSYSIENPIISVIQDRGTSGRVIQGTDRDSDRDGSTSRDSIKDSSVGEESFLDITGNLEPLQAFLPTFYSSTGIKIFDLTDGYDAMIMQAVLTKMLNSMKREDIETLCKDNPEVKLDAFGNLCVLVDNNPIVIVPAAANKNINNETENNNSNVKINSVNLLNSIVVNGLLVDTNSKSYQVWGSAGYLKESQPFFGGIHLDGNISQIGLPAISASKKIKARGKIILYKDSDPIIISSSLRNKRSRADTNQFIDALVGTGAFSRKTNNSAEDTKALESTEASSEAAQASNSGEAASSSSEEAQASSEAAQASNEAASSEISVSETEAATVEVSMDDFSSTGEVPRGEIKLNSTDETTELPYGEALDKVLDKSMSSAPFKIEMTGINTTDIVTYNTISKLFSKDVRSAEISDNLAATQIGLLQIQNMAGYTLPGDENVLKEVHLVTGGKNNSSAPLLGDYYYISPNPSTLKESENTAFDKDFGQYAWKKMDGSTGNPASYDLRTTLRTLNSPGKISRLLTSKDTSEFQSLLESGINGRNGSTLREFAKLRVEIPADDGFDEYRDSLLKLIDSSKYKLKGTEYKGISNNWSYFNQLGTRLIKVYEPSPIFRAVANIFGIEPGANFKQYTTDIYLTYLLWYGVLDSKNGENLRLNTKLFEGAGFLTLDPDKMINSLTDEEKDSIIKNNLIKLLNTGEAGRKYRKDLMSGLAEDMADYAYQRSSQGDGVGFLNVNSYKDNLITSFIISRFDSLSLGLFGIIFILIMLNAVMRKKGLAWLIAAEFSTLLAILAIPAYIEIAPYICNNAIQKAFSENSIYWLAAESTGNQDIADQSNGYFGEFSNMSSDEASKTAVLLNSIRMQQSSKTLLIRQDTSKRVIEAFNIDSEKLQSRASTRWLIPSIIQQIQDKGSKEDYVYITAHDWFGSMARGYLVSSGDKGEEAAVSASFMNGEFITLTDANYSTKFNLDFKKASFPNYIDTSESRDIDSSNRSISRVSDTNNNKIHTTAYFINDLAAKIPEINGAGDGITKEDWDAYAKDINTKIGDIKAFTDYNEKLLSHLGEGTKAYNRYDNNIPPYFTNLYSLEGVGSYFYNVVKDTFPVMSQNTESLAKELLGNYTTVEKAEDGRTEEFKVRTSFMHKGYTEKTRDILDLEEMFTNMLPYLYAEQLVMGGENGTSGVLGDATLGNKYPIYKDNLNSWMYRCNWVTKIITDGKYSKEAVIGMPGGARVKINNMVDPRSYSSNRPMVFSEAQQDELGLNNSDLNLLELKLVRINREVCDEWTKLINYANISGMTVETLERLMTATATFKFNTILTRNSLFNARLSQYPRSSDLRNITWDTLFRHMLVSSSHNSTFLTSKNIMRYVIQSVGIFVGFLAMIITFLSASIIPMFKDIILTSLLAFVIMSLILNLYKGAKEKLKTTTGWCFTYLVFSIFTCLFYYLIAKFMCSGNVSKLIGSNTSPLSTASLTYKIVLMTILDITYIFGLVYYIRKVILNGGLTGLMAYIKDGGYSFFRDTAYKAISGVRRSISGAVGSIKGGYSAVTNRIFKTKVVNKENEPLSTKVEGGQVETKKHTKSGIDNERNDSSYSDLDEINKTETKRDRDSKEKIESEVERGKEMLDKQDQAS